MNRVLMLLELALVGCRDACYRKAKMRASAELELASSVLHALLRKPDQKTDELAACVAEYGKMEDEIANNRYEIYSGILAKLDSEDVDLPSTKSSPRFQAVYSTIATGIHNVQQALTGEDFSRGELEADHIHNLPSLLETPHQQAFDDYLKRERPFYLSRLAEEYGEEVEENAKNEFENHWEAMANESS